MLIPSVKKLIYRKDIFVERTLPAKGTISAKVGDAVEPFTKLGISRVSYGEMYIDSKFKPAKITDSYFYSGKPLGKLGLKAVTAPFDGYIHQIDTKWVFKQEERDFWLLSGVWGAIADVSKDKAVLIKTQVVDVHFIISTNIEVQGELIVFPNPSEELEMHYLENFSKGVYGKILYIGSFVDKRMVERAAELGVSGIIAGGTDVSSFNYVKKQGIFMGLLTGFGHMKVSKDVFTFLNNISNRYVFAHGENNILRVPVTEDAGRVTNMTPFLEVYKGMPVLVLQKPYFGWYGNVEAVNESSVIIKFEEKTEPVEIGIPNILAVE